MDRQAKELSLVASYIMYHDLLEGTEFDGSFWYKIEIVQKIAEEFIKVYPHEYNWDGDLQFEETLEEWVRIYAEEIINNKNK